MTIPHSFTTRDLMFGIHAGDETATVDYDPWLHADMLDVPIATNDTLPGRMLAAYSRRYNAIFVRSNTHGTAERCAIAHEIVHFERHDVGTTPTQERRADRIAASRLIRPSRAAEIFALYSDVGEVALQLDVTERIMKAWIRHYGQR